MMTRARALQGATLATFAAAGVLAGHVLHYLLAVPDPAHRHEVLSSTGHGYLPAAGLAVLMVAAIAAAGCFAVGFRRGLDGGDALPPALRAVAVRLSVIQAAGFCMLEPAERLVAGAHLHDLTPAFLMAGIVVQIAVATLAATVVVLLDRSGEQVALMVAGRVHGPSGSTPRVQLPAGEAEPFCTQWAGRRAVRGPPALLTT